MQLASRGCSCQGQEDGVRACAWGASLRTAGCSGPTRLLLAAVFTRRPHRQFTGSFGLLPQTGPWGGVGRRRLGSGGDWDRPRHLVVHRVGHMLVAGRDGSAGPPVRGTTVGVGSRRAGEAPRGGAFVSWG